VETSELARKAIAFLGTYLLHSTLFLGAAWLLWKSGRLRTPRNSERVLRLALCGGILTSALQLSLGMQPILGQFHIGIDKPSESFETTTLAHGSEGYRNEESPSRGDANGHDDGNTKTHDSDSPTPNSDSHSSSSAALRMEPVGEPDRPDERDRRRRGDRSRDESSSESNVPGRSISFEPPKRDPLLTGSLGSPAQSITSLPTWNLSGALRPLLYPLALTLPLTGLAWIVLTCFGVQRKLGRRRLLNEGPLFDQLAHLCTQAKLPYRIRLSVSERLTSPVSFGLFRPEIAVPRRALLDLSASQAEGMLAHELAHAKRRDAFWFQLYFLVERLFFVQPLNRFARRQLVDSAELLCDDQAVRWTGSRLGLASCLTTVAEWHVTRREASLPLAGMAAPRSNLSERVERLLDDRQSPVPDGRGRLGVPLALGTLTLVTFVAPSAAGRSMAEGVVPDEPAFAPRVSAPLVSAPRAIDETEHDAFADEDFDLGDARALMQEEIVALEGECTALADELRECDVDPNLVRAITEVEARVLKLRENGERLDALLERVRARTTQQNPAGIP